MIKRFLKRFVYAGDAVTVGNLFGANIPPTVPGIGSKVCGAICAKLGFCVCSSALSVWIVGIAAALVVGEIAMRLLG
jgi:hypothetical protein